MSTPLSSPTPLPLTSLMLTLTLSAVTVMAMMEELMLGPPDVIEITETATDQPAPPLKPAESKTGPILIKVSPLKKRVNTLFEYCAGHLLSNISG